MSIVDAYVQYRTAEVNAPLISSMQALFPYSKERLFSFILCGNVKVDEETVKDHTREVKKDSTIALYDDELMDKAMASSTKRYVSRGGEKLAPVLSALQVEVAGKILLDCGCATGGFTDCLLANNAKVVHAVDVAYNTLDYRLRIDSRVIVHERCNVLNLSHLDPPPTMAVADLSFRSLRRISAYIISLCEEKYLLALCKPQFEYVEYQKNMGLESREREDDKEFDGVIENKDTIFMVMNALLKDLYEEGVLVRSIHPAGIKGRRGNQEYFLELIGLEGVEENSTIESKEILYQKYEELLREVIFNGSSKTPSVVATC